MKCFGLKKGKEHIGGSILTCMDIRRIIRNKKMISCTELGSTKAAMGGGEGRKCLEKKVFINW